MSESEKEDASESRVVRLAETFPRWSTIVTIALHIYSFVFSTTLYNPTNPKINHDFAMNYWRFFNSCYMNIYSLFLLFWLQEHGFAVVGRVMKLRLKVSELLWSKYNTALYRSIEQKQQEQHHRITVITRKRGGWLLGETCWIESNLQFLQHRKVWEMQEILQTTTFWCSSVEGLGVKII